MSLFPLGPALGPGAIPGPGAGPRWCGLLTALLVAAWVAPAWAHGVSAAQVNERAVVVRAVFSDGTPMRFAKVRVTSPEGRTYQVGHSDAQGCFALVPDQAGEWRLAFDDGMGHLAEVVVPAVAQAQPSAQTGSGPETSPLTRALWGLSAIFWVTGLIFWWRGGKGRSGP